jgi:hypothetical protein
MISLIQPSSTSGSTTEEILFQFQDLEITRNTLVMRFLDEPRVTPLKEIASYHLKWYLHDPTSAKKYWFLVLTIVCRDGRDESGPIAVAEFSHNGNERELREDIEANIAEAIDLVLSCHNAGPRKLNCFEQDGIDASNGCVKLKIIIRSE